MEIVAQSEAELFNRLEKLMSGVLNDVDGKYQPVDCPLEHTFTPGLYSRKIFMPAGTIVISEKHKTRHQYCILEGVVSVFIEGKGWEILQAGHTGITEAGTQRLLKIEDDCTWITYHATEFTTVEEVHEHIIEKTYNPLIEGKYQNNVFIPEQKIIIKE